MIKSNAGQLFSKDYILGGSPCSGKSTLAGRVAAQYGLRSYKADDYEPEHMQRAEQERQPVMFKYSKIGWNEIWSQPPATLLADELAYYHERFAYILDDLSKLDMEEPVILEGAAFLPELIHQYPLKCANVVFMIPTMEFRLHHYRQRPWIQSILEKCHNPNQAFENWMRRDELFGQEVTRQANIYGFRVIVVDGSVNIQEQFEVIKTQFQLGNHKQTP